MDQHSPSLEEIKKALKKLKDNKGVIMDGVPYEFLKMMISGFSHMISRFSASSDNHSEGAKFWSDTKLLARQLNRE